MFLVHPRPTGSERLSRNLTQPPSFPSGPSRHAKQAADIAVALPPLAHRDRLAPVAVAHDRRDRLAPVASRAAASVLPVAAAAAAAAAAARAAPVSSSASGPRSLLDTFFGVFGRVPVPPPPPPLAAPLDPPADDPLKALRKKHRTEQKRKSYWKTKANIQVRKIKDLQQQLKAEKSRHQLTKLHSRRILEHRVGYRGHTWPLRLACLLSFVPCVLV